jgi:ectoine hydroxylase
MKFLRRIKFLYFINNLLHKNELKCNEDLYKKFGLKKNVTSLLKSNDFTTLKTLDIPWLDDLKIAAQQITDTPSFKNFNPQVQEAILSWSKNGYIILPSFFTYEEVNTINNEIAALQKKRKAKTRLDERIIFAIKESQTLYSLATKKDLVEILSFILGKKVKIFQSLNFTKGSQQKAHSDTIHMTTYPLGYLIAVWIALEDITEESGPLFYYPKSHKLPYVLNDNFNHGGNNFLLGKNSYQKYEDAIDAVIQKNNLKKEVFIAKKGDIFIWHANILHGGEQIINPNLTRKSMVLHYFTEDVICYHEITQRPAIFNGNEAHCPQ